MGVSGAIGECSPRGFRIRSLRCLCLLLLLLVTSASAGEPPRKKLIEWAAVEPTTTYMREHVREMEKLPFDGLVFHLKTDDYEQMVWNMWGERAFTVDQFSREIADLEATPFEKLTERFLRCNVTPGNVDWADDGAWQKVLDNFSTAAKIVQRTGCRGIMFDTEQYVHEPFEWPPSPQEESPAAPESEGVTKKIEPTPEEKAILPEVTALVRKRGREWIQAINAECPEITILVTYAWRSGQPTEGESFRLRGYELLPAFLDGVLEGASDTTRIVDAWEYSYPYRARAEFEKGRRSMTLDALEWTSVPDEYRQHVTAGFGLWMDFNVRGYDWHVDDLLLNYNSPEQFRQNLFNAFDLTDEYVWIYTGEVKWWTGESLPAEYRAVVERERKAVGGSAP